MGGSMFSRREPRALTSPSKRICMEGEPGSDASGLMIRV